MFSSLFWLILGVGVGVGVGFGVRTVADFPKLILFPFASTVYVLPSNLTTFPNGA
jgi:hypothetical protein